MSLSIIVVEVTTRNAATTAYFSKSAATHAVTAADCPAAAGIAPNTATADADAVESTAAADAAAADVARNT